MSGLFSNLLRKNSMDGKESAGKARAKRVVGVTQRAAGKVERSRSTEGHVIPPRVRTDQEGSDVTHY